jgi:hypothetical protein
VFVEVQNVFILPYLKNPYGFTDVQESVTQQIGMTIIDLALLPGSSALLLPTFMFHPFFVQDYGLLHI